MKNLVPAASHRLTPSISKFAFVMTQYSSSVQHGLGGRCGLWVGPPLDPGWAGIIRNRWTLDNSVVEFLKLHEVFHGKINDVEICASL